jgi:hypothetical protein
MTTALGVGDFRTPVRKDCAMTERLRCAARCCDRRPEGKILASRAFRCQDGDHSLPNKKDLEDVPAEILKKIKIVRYRWLMRC